MKKLWPALLMIAACLPSGAHAQIKKADAHREANFLFEVKIIDEFIERFNDDSASSLRKEYKRARRDIPFSREDLLRSLFDRPVKPDDPGTKDFIAQVANAEHPQYIGFNDTNWYAEVSCLFTMDGQSTKIPLIMQVMTAADKSSKWMITGIGDSYVFKDEAARPAAQSTENGKLKKFISPSDYATNFLELHHILTPGMNADYYFVPQLLATEKGNKFVQLIQAKKLKFVHTDRMRFYFFQIPNYVFTVERFLRQSTHSGWLISDLSAASAEEKRTRVEKLLQRSL